MSSDLSNIPVASTAIGIDMGTSNCYVGVYKSSAVEVIANEQGNRATPCYLSFTAKEQLVGEAAYNYQHLNQANTVFHAKTMLGYDYKDAAFQQMLETSNFPFTVLEGPNGKPLVEVEYQGSTQQFTPEQLVATLFKQIKGSASKYMGFPISKAVISLPTNYNEKQKQALLEAAKLAELEVLSLCSEPAAVAMAYKLDEPPTTAAGVGSTSHENVVVVDVGGMATTVTILGVKAGIFEILGEEHDAQHGGEHIDEKLVEYFVKEFARKNDGLDLQQSKRGMTRLRHHCEKAKEVLSSSTNAPIEIDAIYEGVDLFSAISRAKFEGMFVSFFKQVAAVVERALAKANVEKDDVSALIFAGGCGKIPKLREVVSNFFGPRVRVLGGAQNADEAVAYGCAVQATLLVSADANAAVSDLRDVKLNTLSIGVETASGEFQVIIPKNTPLPTMKTIHASVADVAKGGVIQLFEGELLKKATANHHLATLALPKLAGTTQLRIDVTMDTDANIELHVTHSQPKVRVSLSIPAASGKKLSEAEVSKLLAEGHKEHQELLAANQILKAQVDALEIRGAHIKSEVAAHSAALSEGERKMMTKAVDDVTSWLESITIGAIIQAKPEEIERKSKGIDLIFTPLQKKIENFKNKEAEPAPVTKMAAPEPPMGDLDMGDLD